LTGFERHFCSLSALLEGGKEVVGRTKYIPRLAERAVAGVGTFTLVLILVGALLRTLLSAPTVGAGRGTGQSVGRKGEG